MFLAENTPNGPTSKEIRFLQEDNESSSKVLYIEDVHLGTSSFLLPGGKGGGGPRRG